jgi:hypothetical protein
MSSEAIILKRDAGGRVVVPVQRQVELVREYESSGLSGPKFAALAGLRYQTFATWRRKHGTQPPSRMRAAAPTLPATTAWMEAVVEPQSSMALTLRLPGGTTAEITHPGQAALAAQLLKAIATPSC